MKVPVTERALVQRINRKLKPAGQQLRRARRVNVGGAYEEDCNLGRYFVIDLYSGILSRDVDLESWARDAGALAPYEELAAAD